MREKLCIRKIKIYRKKPFTIIYKYTDTETFC